MKFNFQNLFSKARSIVYAPEYLKMPSCAFDISDHSIKYMELEFDAYLPVLKNYEKKIIEKGIIQEGIISNKDKLTDAIKYFKDKYPKYKFANINLPEESAFAFKLDFDAAQGQKDIRTYVESQLSENLPFPADKAIFDFKFLQDASAIYVLAYPKALVEDYILAFENAGFVVKRAELETLSMARAIIPKDKINSLSVVIDIGNSKLGISAFVSLLPVFTTTIAYPIGKEFKELYRKTHGGKDPVNAIEFFDWKFKEGLVLADSNVTENFLSEIFDNVSNILTFIESTENRKIDAIYLSGGNAATKGVDSFFATKLKKPVFLGNTWENLYDLEKNLPSVNYKESFMYSTLIGLLLADKYSV